MFKVIPAWALVAGLGALGVGTTMAVVHDETRTVSAASKCAHDTACPKATGDSAGLLASRLGDCAKGAGTAECLDGTTFAGLNQSVTQARGILADAIRITNDSVQKASLQHAEQGLNEAYANAHAAVTNALNTASDAAKANLLKAEKNVNAAFAQAQSAIGKAFGAATDSTQKASLQKAETAMNTEAGKAQAALGRIVADVDKVQSKTEHVVNGVQSSTQSTVNSTQSTVNGVQSSTQSTLNGVQSTTQDAVNGVQGTVAVSSGSGSTNTGTGVSVGGNTTGAGVNVGTTGGGVSTGVNVGTSSGAGTSGISVGLSTPSVP